MAWAAALPPSAVSKTTLLPSSCSMEAARDTSGGSMAADPATPTLMVDLTAKVADVPAGSCSDDDTLRGITLGRSPAFAVCPMCGPSVRLRRIRCCHMHMNHAMLALGQIEAMPSQREG
jgi:hypothetical protein